MTQELYIPPSDCPQPEEAQAAVQARVAHIVDRVRQRGEAPVEDWQAFERTVIARLVELELLRCPVQDTVGCASQSSCQLAQQPRLVNM